MTLRTFVLKLFALAFAVALAGCGTIGRLTGTGDNERILDTGIGGLAKVLNIHESGWTVNENPVVDFDLEVIPAEGEPYTAQARALISRLHIPQIQPGAVLPVKIDPADRSKVALDIYERDK